MAESMRVGLLSVAASAQAGVPPVRARAQQALERDRTSAALKATLPAAHKSAASLLAQIAGNSAAALAEVENKLVESKDRLTFEGLLSGVLVRGETVLARLEYDSATTKGPTDEEEVSFTRACCGRGHLVLTALRIILLSALAGESVTLTTFGNPKTMVGAARHGYTVQAAVADATSYFPIPLQTFRHVSMQAKTGVATSRNITAQAPCCPCCICCCTKTWHSSAPQPTTQINERHLAFGVLMPPWDGRANMFVEVTRHVPLTAIRDFLSEFQRVQPSLARAPPMSPAAAAASPPPETM